MQTHVIFPRVHVARNERRIDRQPPHLGAMHFEETAQTFLLVELLQFIAIFEIDQNGMPAAAIVFRLDETCAGFPRIDDLSDCFRTNGWMIDESNQ